MCNRQQNTNKTKHQFFEKINKVDNPSEMLIKKKGEKPLNLIEKKQIHMYREQTSGQQWEEGCRRVNIEAGVITGTTC